MPFKLLPKWLFGKMEFLIRKPCTDRKTHDVGDVFARFPDGHCERPGRNSVYWLVRFPIEYIGIEIEEKILKPGFEKIPVKEQEIVKDLLEEGYRKIHRRKLKFNWDLLPPICMDELNIKGFCVVPFMNYSLLFVEK